MRLNRGITIQQTLVAIAIILSTVAVVWLTIGRQAKLGAVGTVVRSELQQLHAALHLYMADHDDAYPRGMSVLGRFVPGIPQKTSAVKTPISGCSTWLAYQFSRNADILKGEMTYQAQVPFDLSRDPIFTQHFFCRIPGSKERVIFRNLHGEEVSYIREVKKVLAIRMDGQVGWFDLQERWAEEFASNVRP